MNTELQKQFHKNTTKYFDYVTVFFTHTHIYLFFHLVNQLKNQLKYLSVYILRYLYFYLKIFSLLQSYYGMEHGEYNVSLSIFIFKHYILYFKNKTNFG